MSNRLSAKTTIRMAAMWGMSSLLRENIFSWGHVVNNNYGNAREQRGTDRKKIDAKFLLEAERRNNLETYKPR